MNIQRKPGDWNCKNCQHLNFSRRDYCQRCRDPRPDLQFSDGYSTGGVLTSLDIRPGTSQQDKVQAALRVTLLADATAPQFVLGGKLATGSAQGDQTISASFQPGCNVHNFASRMECYRCNGPREAGTGK
ncbi:unnamed protein product [Miscanthus lutarioriparius]|uniref:RanBP2-type domain-containing protein n=1 Tax=Miscanthus lutarioriparius TaxID=422564 RepID=A0A811SEL7_9POAL|nr:unnamed protein product [Miscanthus lutarioriparius]